MRREALISVGLGLVAGTALTLHPFTRAIEYPQALLLAPLASLVAMIRATWVTTTPEGSLVRSWTRALVAPALFCGTALGPPAVGSLFGDVCDPLSGLGFHALGPWASAAAAAALGVALTALPLRRRWRVALGVSLVVLSPVVPLLEFFTGPSVRFYTTFFGLYHGAIYDEAVFVEGPYVWFRLWNACGLGALLVGLDAWRGRLPRWSLAPAGVAAIAWPALLIPAINPGFITTTRHLDAHLPPAATCEHFVVHARPEGPAARLAEAACRDLEYRLSQQRAVLGLEPSRVYHAYLYDSPLHKAARMGAGKTSIARPWQGQLHIVFTGVGTRLTAHELVHVYAAEAATSPLGIPVRRGVLPVAGLLEGLAVALEPPRPMAPLHDWSAAMRRTIDTPSMAALMSPAGFWSHAGGKVYTLAGSFVRWLLETRGASAVTALYGGAGFEEATGESLEALEAAWGAYLDARELDPLITELAAFIYDRPSVLEKRCPYAVGRCTHDALQRLARQGPEAALPLVRRAVAYDSDRLDGLRLLARLLAAVRDTKAAHEVLDVASEREGLSETQRATLSLARADVLLMAGERDAAQELLRSLPPPAARLWRGAVYARLRLGLLGPDLEGDLPGLLGLTSRSARRAQIETLLGSRDRHVACLAVGRALANPGLWEAEVATVDRCLAAAAAPDRCALAATARRAAWVEGAADEARRWHEVLEDGCAETIGIRPDELLDWRLRIDWEQGREGVR